MRLPSHEYLLGAPERGFEQALASGTVTEADWAPLHAVLRRLAPLPSPQSRRLLSVWENDRYTLEPGVRYGLQNFLGSVGYPVALSSSPTLSRPQRIRRLLDGNVAEADRLFEQLARRVGRTDGELPVAVVDGGTDLTHQALASKSLFGWDYVDDVADPKGDPHGTQVAGVATRGTARLPLIAARAVTRAMDPQRVAAAIDDAAARGARLINLSFTVASEHEVGPILAAIDRHPTVLFTKAAGNTSRGTRIGEGAFASEVYLAAQRRPNLLVVAAADEDGNRWEHSNYSEDCVALAAPGVDIYSTAHKGKYTYCRGTSFAAPYVLNLAAKCWLLDPGLSIEQMKRLLVVTSTPHSEWGGLIEAEGPVDAATAMRVAALCGLWREGEDPGALRLIGGSVEEQARLSALARRVLDPSGIR